MMETEISALVRRLHRRSRNHGCDSTILGCVHLPSCFCQLCIRRNGAAVELVQSRIGPRAHWPLEHLLQAHRSSRHLTHASLNGRIEYLSS